MNQLILTKKGNRMNLFNKIILCLTLVLMTLSLTNLSRADAHSDRLDNIESQVQDALIKIKGMEKKTKDVPTIKVGPGLKIKSGKNEVKFGGRVHFDVGMYDENFLLNEEKDFKNHSISVFESRTT